MDEYTDLLQRMRSHPCLLACMDRMTTENTESLNLLTPHWKSVLENDPTFQDMKWNPQTHFRKPSQAAFGNTPSTPPYAFYDMKTPLKILVAAHCQLFCNKDRSIVTLTVKKYNPLTEITRALLSDLDPSEQMMDECKLTFMTCHPVSCDTCSSALQSFRENKIPVEVIPQPCIQNTFIFDGKRILNRFLSQMKNSFQQTFVALIRASVHQRYYYTNTDGQRVHRISAEVKEITAFYESKLSPERTIDLGEFKPPSCTGMPIPSSCTGIPIPSSSTQYDTGIYSPQRERIEAYPQVYKKMKWDELDVEEGIEKIL